MGVKYQVERRPISKSGKVYRGTGYGDYITVLTHPQNMETPGAVENLGSTTKAVLVPPGVEVPTLGTSSPAKSHVQEVNGEPWLVHSTHFSVESALESAAPLAGALGKENVRIVKVLSHTTQFKLI
jgi:hypothetical protein